MFSKKILFTSKKCKKKMFRVKDYFHTVTFKDSGKKAV